MNDNTNSVESSAFSTLLSEKDIILATQALTIHTALEDTTTVIARAFNLSHGIFQRRKSFIYSNFHKSRHRRQERMFWLAGDLPIG